MRVVGSLALLAAAAAAGPPAWTIGPSEFLRYERRTVTRKGDKETFGGPSIRTVQGHDIRDGQYAPLGPTRANLPALLGLRLPPGGTVALDLHAVIPVRGRVTIEAHDRDGKVADVASTWTFASRGKERKGDKDRLRKGTAHVRAVFDVERGRFASARVTLEYVLERLDPKKGEKARRAVAREWDLRLFERRAPEESLRAEVNAAIDKGVAHLKTLQREDRGSFEPHGKYEIGSAALAVFTLCACEVPRTDPVVAGAIAWLRRQEPKKTYERAVCLMAIEKAYTPPGELRHAVKAGPRDVPADLLGWCRAIAADLERTAQAPGSWGYPTSTRLIGPHVDSSNTQYAVLGLRAAARMGLPVAPGTWQGVVRHFKQHRERGGPRGDVAIVREGEAVPREGDRDRNRVPVRAVKGFRYKTSHPAAWGSMTCAGIASLRIALHQLGQAGKAPPRLAKEAEEMILGAWAWLERFGAMDRNPLKHGNNWYYYYLYSLERAAILDRVKRLGGRHWYFEGASQLLARQKEKGMWDAPGKGDLAETCFALLFLKRATAPLTQAR